MSEENIKFFAEMGFSEEHSKRALKIHNDNVQESLEWLLAHQEEFNQLSSTKETETSKLTLSLKDKETKPTEEAGKSEQNDQQINSLKCDDCGILLKDEDFATLHAHKTGHVNFSQSTESIKPKTKEEIEEQKQRLKEKLIKLRAEKTEKEKKEKIELEKKRRLQGREINDFKQKFQEDEMKRIAEQKRREKIADAAYKKKLLEDIAADREAKKLAREAEAAKNTGIAPTASTPKSVEPVVVNEKKTYDECRIQVRLTDGKTMVEKFKATEQLAAVRLWIENNRTDDKFPFNLMTTFPRKVYTEDDMMRSLKDLNLVPATSLVVSKQ